MIARRSRRPSPFAPRPLSPLLLAGVPLALLGGGCGRSPLGGLEGEYCVVDEDCAGGLTCEQRICLALEEGGEDEPPAQRGEFFAGLRLHTYTGAGEGSLRQLGQFLGDLSGARFPYWVLDAPDAVSATFGRADRTAEPVVVDTAETRTAMSLSLVGTTYLAASATLPLPVSFSDDSVSLDFDLLLRDAVITVDFALADPAYEGSGTMTAVLLADDAENAVIVRTDRSFTVRALIASEPMDVDYDLDGELDGWTLSWDLDAEWL